MKNQLNLIQLLEHVTGLRFQEINRVVDFYKNKYKKYSKKKLAGGYRIIYHPARPMKMLQSALDLYLLRTLPVSPIARAYIPNLRSPLRVIALEHMEYNYTLRVDFENFFPSIKPDDLFYIISKNYLINDDEKELLQNILFFCNRGSYCLPVGAPSSPSVSNAVMYECDEFYFNLCKQIDPSSSISRYADDIYFSTNIKGGCRLFFEKISEGCGLREHPRLKINDRKTLYLSKGTKRLICGVSIASQGFISIGRKRKQEIKKMLYMCQNGELDNKGKLSLRGKMAFVKDVEPDYYNRLIIKYGKLF